MIYYARAGEVDNMWFFHKKSRDAEAKVKEAKIQALHSDTLKSINRLNVSTQKTNEELEKDGGVTFRIF